MADQIVVQLPADLAKSLQDGSDAAKILRNMRGPGVTNTGGAIRINQTSAPRQLQSTSPSGFLFPVDLTVTVATAALVGDLTTAAGFKYTATRRGGVALATTAPTDLVPQWPREFGMRVAATKGQGYFGSDGAFVLEIAYEVDDTAGCGG